MSVDVSPAAKAEMNVGNGTHSMEVRDVHKAFGPFEILTEGNFIVEGGGFCDSGNRSEYLIARVKP